MPNAKSRQYLFTVLQISVACAAKPGACAAISISIWPEGLQTSSPGSRQVHLLRWGLTSLPSPHGLVTCERTILKSMPLCIERVCLEQVHRPPPLTTVVVPLKSQGYEHLDILQRSLWLGHQV